MDRNTSFHIEVVAHHDLTRATREALGLSEPTDIVNLDSVISIFVR